MLEKNITLATKYRPKTFKELIGQDIVSTTITNAIKQNKVPNAYLLTGIRGIGKTTTARIVAKSLNCSKGIDNVCNSEMCNDCSAIAQSNHLDVIEMDAASKTGIDDIRDLIESSQYKPINAKFKIFIIDEVHMLSKQAFNGLLKTLEEPPPHLKFIFVTTEIKKIPVTIISRCQRFDLSRVSIKDIYENLKKISLIEKGNITNNALISIAKASEGSVRDSLSLLDRALVGITENVKSIDEFYVEKMLGLTSKANLFKLIEKIFDGDPNLAIELLRNIFEDGAEPKLILNDLLEVIYLLIREKNLGTLKEDISLSESEKNSIAILAKKVDTVSLLAFWQFLTHSLNELNIVSNQYLSLEMTIIRLVHLKKFPNFEEIIENLSKDKNMNIENKNYEKILNEDEKKQNLFIEKNITKNQIKNTDQKKIFVDKDEKIQDTKLKTDILSFEDLLNIVTLKREIELKYDLERNVRIVSFNVGKIDINFNENIGKNFVRSLSEKLFEWTGKRWIISFTKEKGNVTHFEKRNIINKQEIERVKEGKLYTKIKESFPDIELVKIEKENKND